MIIPNKIWIDEIMIVDRKKEGRCFYLIMENGQKLLSSKKYKCKIECNKCKGFIYNKLSIDKKYSPLYKICICFKCLNSGSSNPFYGKKHKKEFKDSLSKQRKRTWYVGANNHMHGVNVYSRYTKKEYLEICKKISDSITGDKNHFYGKKHTIESKKRMSNSQKQYCIDHPERIELLIKNGIKSCQKKGRMTYIERIIYNELEKRNIKFKYNKILHRRYQYDFLINDDILLEVHGDFWHCNPEIYGEGKKRIYDRQIFKMKKDEEKKAFAEKYGYKIYVIWEKDINLGNFSVLDKICSQNMN